MSGQMEEREMEKKMKEYREQRTRELKKGLFKEAGTLTLVTGIVFLALVAIIIIYVYSYLAGMTSGGGDVILTHEGISRIIPLGFLMLFIGSFGGFEIGRYVQTQFTRMRGQLDQPPPPPSK